jgi:hypothetical protein
MPQAAFIDGKRVNSPLIPENEWNTIKEIRPLIIMCCCGEIGIAKTYHKYGTQFFAHKTKNPNCHYKKNQWSILHYKI